MPKKYSGHFVHTNIQALSVQVYVGTRRMSVIPKGIKDFRKSCECHSSQKVNMIEECIEFKNVICRLFNMESIPNSWGNNVLLVSDEPLYDIPVIERTRFFQCSFMTFRKTMMEIYSKLV